MKRLNGNRWICMTIALMIGVGTGVLFANTSREHPLKRDDARAILVRGDRPITEPSAEKPDHSQLLRRGSRDLGITGAADRMLEKMCPAECSGKGWGWELECPALPTQLPANTIGSAANGLLRGYERTDDARHLLGAFDAADYASCYAFANGEHRYSVGNPFFIWQLNHVVPSATSYTDTLRTHFFQALDNGTYGDPTNYTTLSYCTDYLAALRTEAQSNYRVFDALDLPKVTEELGTPDQANIVLSYFQDRINQISTAKSYDVIALASAVYGLPIVNAVFDPTSGSFASEDSVLDLADRLTTYQHPDGGFIYDTDLVDAAPVATTWTLGSGRWYSGSADYMNATLTKFFNITTSPVITFDLQYDIEDGYDFGFVEYSVNGFTWTALAGTHTTPPDNGITGCQTGYTTETVTLPATGVYRIRFRFFTDSIGLGNDPVCTVNPAGFYIDNITIDGVTDPCTSSNGWVASTASYPVGPENQSLQVTDYAVLALKAADIWRYQAEIDAGMDWILDNQLANGGFLDPIYGEYNLTNGESLYALMYAPECFNDGDVNNSGDLTPEDAQLAFQFYLESFPQPAMYHDFCSSDCNGDGAVTPADSHCIIDHYLDDSCDCADPIVLASAKSSKLARQDRGFIVTQDFDAEAEEGTITISVRAPEPVSLDAFGLRVSIPGAWTLEQAAPANPAFWQIHAARITSNDVKLGAFARQPVRFEPGQALIRIRYESHHALDVSKVVISDCVDDIGGWER